MSFQQEYDATIATSEDLNLPRHSGASSSSQHTAASRVPTLLKLGSSRTSLTKVSADYDSVASRTSIKETCADMDRETVVSRLLGSMSKEKREIVIKTLCIHRETGNISIKFLNGKLNRSCEEKKVARQRSYEAETEVEVKHWDKEKFGYCSSWRSIRSSSPDDDSCKRLIN